MCEVMDKGKNEMKRICCLAGLLMFAATAFAADKQILLVAGKPSHPPGQHEHNAGVRLLAKWLNTVPGIHATTSFDGAWPDSKEFDKADAIFFFSDGGENHFVFQENHTADVAKAAARGAGLMFMHYATEPPPKRGHEEMLDWAAGFFDLNYSINPIYDGVFKSFPKHPITRGVKPFQTKDEWYYNIRFPESMKGVTGILVTTPPANTVYADGIRSGNPDVRTKIGKPMMVSWAFERKNGGRSVSLTGGHYHSNLGNADYRKIVLNSLVWVAKAKVPSKGVEVKVTPEELTENLDPKPARPRPAEKKSN